MRKLDLIGVKFGRLTVIADAGRHKGRMVWLCECECGEKTIVRGGNLTSKRGIKSCGCLAREILSSRSITHGHSVGAIRSLEYVTWQAMINRCTKPSHQHYRLYGGNGVTICDRWLFSFENFLEDMGKRPSKEFTLDRYPNRSGNYEPSNCRWATKMEQNRNQSINRWFTHSDGRTMIMSDWANEFNTSPSVIAYWIAKDKTIDEIEERMKLRKSLRRR